MGNRQETRRSFLEGDVREDKHSWPGQRGLRGREEVVQSVTCLCLPRSEIQDVHHHTQPLVCALHTLALTGHISSSKQARATLSLLGLRKLRFEEVDLKAHTGQLGCDAPGLWESCFPPHSCSWMGRCWPSGRDHKHSPGIQSSQSLRMKAVQDGRNRATDTLDNPFFPGEPHS